MTQHESCEEKFRNHHWHQACKWLFHCLACSNLGWWWQPLKQALWLQIQEVLFKMMMPTMLIFLFRGSCIRVITNKAFFGKHNRNASKYTYICHILFRQLLSSLRNTTKITMVTMIACFQYESNTKTPMNVNVWGYLLALLTGNTCRQPSINSCLKMTTKQRDINLP